LQAVAVKYAGKVYDTFKEPFTLTLPGGVDEPLPLIAVECVGHYREPVIQLECPPIGHEQMYRMAYEVLAQTDWVVTKEEPAAADPEEVLKEEAGAKEQPGNSAEAPVTDN